MTTQNTGGVTNPSSTNKPKSETKNGLAGWLFSPLVGVHARDWFSLMRRYGGDIPPRYWARTGFTSAMSLINAGLSGRESRRYGEAISSAKVEAPVFILGHHRSGTTHLWNLLAQDPRFAYPTVVQALFPHTFLSFESVVHRFGGPFTPKKRPQDNVAFGLEAPLEEERALCAATFMSMQMVRHFPQKQAEFERFLSFADASAEERQLWKNAFDGFARKLMVRYGDGRRLLFKEPAHTARIELLLELYPDARFIHIHRHPFEVYRSTMAMERVTRPLYAYQPTDEEALEDFVLWRYRAMYDAYFKAAEKVPAEQLMDIAYDRLDANPKEVLAEIYERLGLGDFETVSPKLDAYLASLSGYKKNRHPELPPATAEKVAQAWAPSFENWGYRP